GYGGQTLAGTFGSLIGGALAAIPVLLAAGLIHPAPAGIRGPVLVLCAAGDGLALARIGGRVAPAPPPPGAPAPLPAPLPRQQPPRHLAGRRPPHGGGGGLGPGAPRQGGGARPCSADSAPGCWGSSCDRGRSGRPAAGCSRCWPRTRSTACCRTPPARAWRGS